ncbi:hypothetical protein AYI69_g6901 [Smittium culicis]|uniref:Uncharacterized protein n=1 Tax=Smittium culicis TaxID=133412 RepID=A0A1R1XVS1_9FUNG|nr:hypothetical protein AYI69_g6901 [Smittium culicis]
MMVFQEAGFIEEVDERQTTEKQSFLVVVLALFFHVNIYCFTNYLKTPTNKATTLSLHQICFFFTSLLFSSLLYRSIYALPLHLRSNAPFTLYRSIYALPLHLRSNAPFTLYRSIYALPLHLRSNAPFTL